MTDTTTYPLSTATSVVVNSAASDRLELAWQIVTALIDSGYSTADAHRAWELVKDAFGRLSDDVSDGDLAATAVAALNEAGFLV